MRITATIITIKRYLPRQVKTPKPGRPVSGFFAFYFRKDVTVRVLNSYERMKKMKEVSNCDSCVNFVYDDEDECYVCDMNLDEDDMVRFLTGTFDNCPYYQLDNEYLVVRHQM